MPVVEPYAIGTCMDTLPALLIIFSIESDNDVTLLHAEESETY